MRLAMLCLLTAATVTVAGLGALALQTQPAHADDPMTLYMSGFEIGKGRSAIVRLRNVSSHASDVFSVRYTVRDPGAGVPITPPGAGDGARLAPGDTLELDLGDIVATYRAGLEVGTYEGPVQFVAFGTGGNFESFGPAAVVAEGQQALKRATFAVAVEWTPQ